MPRDLPGGYPDRRREWRRDDDLWVDEEAGPVVRPFAVTRGRTRSRRRGGDLDLIAVVVTAEVPMPDPVTLSPEDELILERCLRPVPVAELASDLGLPVGVIRVLLGDLLERGLVEVQRPVLSDGRPDVRILKEVIDGLRAL
jgi:DNA-binding transcriptional ArsR family regulator